MAGYRIFRPANDALDDIWKYTAKTWGETQASAYIKSLHDHLQILSDNKPIWRRLAPPERSRLASKTPIYLSRYQQHLIFFREFSDGSIGIMSILHVRMHIPTRLAEDLARIAWK